MRENLKLRIKEILKEQGLDNKTLATKLGKKESYISSVINGGSSMSLNSLCMVADALGVDFPDIFERKDKTPSGGDGVRELKRILLGELAFPEDTTPRICARLLDALRECMGKTSFRAMLSELDASGKLRGLSPDISKLVGDETLEDLAAYRS